MAEDRRNEGDGVYVVHDVGIGEPFSIGGTIFIVVLDSDGNHHLSVDSIDQAEPELIPLMLHQDDLDNDEAA